MGRMSLVENIGISIQNAGGALNLHRGQSLIVHGLQPRMRESDTANCARSRSVTVASPF